MKGFGIGFIRWLVGLVLGVIAAGLLFGLAVRVASIAEATSAIGPFALLATGFGIAFFPVVFSMGTRTPRQVARRGLIGFALEGLLAVLTVVYQLAAPASPIRAGWLSWLAELEGTARDMARSFEGPLLVGALGVFLVAVGLIAFIALRPRATSVSAAPSGQPATTAARGEALTTRAPAVGPARTTALPDATTRPMPTAEKPGAQDEDAKLLADLDNLRKKLPKMGVDESANGGRQ